MKLLLECDAVFDSLTSGCDAARTLTEGTRCAIEYLSTCDLCASCS